MQKICWNQSVICAAFISALSLFISAVAVKFLGGGGGLLYPHFMLLLWVHDRTGGDKCSPDFQLNSGSYWSDCFSAVHYGAIKGGWGRSREHHDRVMGCPNIYFLQNLASLIMNNSSELRQVNRVFTLQSQWSLRGWCWCKKAGCLSAAEPATQKVLTEINAAYSPAETE